MNSISALKKSAVAIALALGVAPGGAHAVLETGLVAYWPLNDQPISATDTTVKDTLNKCNGAKAGGVTFTPTATPTGSESVPMEEVLGYEAVPLWHSGNAWIDSAGNAAPWGDRQFWGQFPRFTKVARFDGSANSTITVPDSATCTGVKGLSTATGYTISAWARTEDVTAVADITTGTPIVDPILARGTDWKLYFEYAKDKIGDAFNPSVSEGRVNRVKFCAGSNCLSYPPEELNRWNLAGDSYNVGGYGYGDDSDSSGALQKGTFPIRPGWWYNITVTYTKAPVAVPVVGAVPPRTAMPPQAVMYINGIKVAASTPPSTATGTSPFPPPPATVGSSLTMGTNGTDVLKGRIDDVRIYNVALKPDDVLILGQGCPPGMFDPKTGKVSLPCVIEGNKVSSSDGYRYGMVGAWQVDMMAVPPKPNPNNYGSDEKNMRFTVAKSTPMPMPAGNTLQPYPNNWVPSEYPWGAMVADFNGDDYDTDRWAYDLVYQRYDADMSTFYFDDFGYMYIPGVKAPGPFSGALAMECYGVDLYYDALYSRFELDSIWSEGQNCSMEMLTDWGTSKRPAKVEEAAAATPAVATP